MDVQEFVHDTLSQIAHAVWQVNETFAKKSYGAEANPPGAEMKGGGSTTYRSVSDVHTIEFDIAVTAETSSEASKEKGGGVRLSVISGALGGKSATATSESIVSRLRFSIPLKLPRPQGKKK